MKKIAYKHRDRLRYWITEDISVPGPRDGKRYCLATSTQLHDRAERAARFFATLDEAQAYADKFIASEVPASIKAKMDYQREMSRAVATTPK